MASAFGETPLGLASEIRNLAAILTRKLPLKVPRYQRPYTWTEREVRRLIQDLRRAYDRKTAFYFIGQIVLVKNRGRLEISDGQQRLATLTMIIAYVRDRLPHRAKHYQQLIMLDGEPRLYLREDDTNFYRGYVQEPGQMAELAKLPETGVDSKDQLANAAQTIADELGGLDDRELDNFLSFIVRGSTLNVMDADERGSAATVYNTVNDRGLELSAADNLKCDLLESSGLTPEEADAAARKWEEHEDKLGRTAFAKLLAMMPFLLTGEQLLSPGDLVTFRDQVNRAGGVRKFLFDQLPRYAFALRSIFNCTVDAGHASADVNRRIKLMKQVEEWDWAPAAITFLAEHSGQHERTRKFFQALDRFTFACELSVIDNRLWVGRYAKAVKHGGDDRVLYGSANNKGALELTEAELLKMIARLNKSAKRDRSRRLLLMRLEAAMPGGSLLSITDDATVEHILPKAGGAWWNDRFPDKRLRDDAANVLGNLILVTHDQNELADVKDYNTKRKIFFNFPGAPVHSLTKDIANIDDWTMDAIEARTERLVRILCADWDLIRGGGASQAA